MEKTVAVVVTYNRIDLLKRCIQCLQVQSSVCDMLIVNNDSTDGTAEWLNEYRMRHQSVHVLHLPYNTGGAGGFYYGIQWALEKKYQYLWIMDDDCLASSNALEELLAASKEISAQGQYGWLSSRCLWIDGSICRMNLQRATPYRDITTFDVPCILAQMASFVSLFVPSEIVRRFGLPIKEFYIWTDDWEFTRRISRKLPCYVVRDSKVVHAMKRNATVNIARDTSDRLERYRYFYRNDVYLYRKEGISGWIWLIMKDLWHTLQVVWIPGKKKAKKIKVIWSGFFQGIAFSPPIHDWGNETKYL